MPIKGNETGGVGEKKKRRRWLKILLLLLVGVAVLIGLGPTIVSTGPVRRMVLQRVNRQINGELSINSWSIGWLSGVSLRGISLRDKESQPVATVESVSLNPSYLSLLGQRARLGKVNIQKPHLDIRFRPDGQTNLEQIGILPGPKPVEPTRKQISFDLQVNDGTVIIHRPEAALLSINNIKADIQMASGKEPLDFRVSCDFADEQGGGQLEAQGHIPRQNDGQLELAQLEAKAAIDVKRFALGLISPLLQRAGLDLSVSGLLDAKVNAELHGLQNVQLFCQANCPDIHLSGELLKTDHFHVRDFSSKVQVGYQDNKLNLETLQLASKLGGIQAQGVAYFTPDGKQAAVGSGRLNGELNFDLPKILNQLPATVRLRQGLKIISGELTAKYNLNSDNGKTALLGSAVLKNLQGSVQGKAVALDGPLELSFDLAHDKEGLTIQQLSLNSSFARLSASGRLDNFQFDSQIELANLNTQLARFIDLGKLNFAGEVFCNGDIRRKNQQLDFRLGLSGKELYLSGLGLQDLHEPAVQLDIEGFVSEIENKQKTAVTVKQAHLSSETAQVQLAGEVNLQPMTMAARVQVNGDLAKLWNLTSLFRQLPKDIQLQGNLDTNLEINTPQAQTLTCAGTTIVRDLKLAQPNRPTIYEPQLRFQHRINYDLNSKALSAELFELSLGGLTVLAEKVKLARQADGQLAVEAAGTVQADLAKLEPWMIMFGKLDPKTQLAGQVFCKGNIRSKNQQFDFQVAVTGKELLVSGLGRRDIYEPQLQANLEGSVSETQGWQKAVITIKQAHLASELAQVESSGQINLQPLAVTAQVQLNGNLEKLWNLASVFQQLPEDIQLQGNLDSRLEIGTGQTQTISCAGTTIVRNLQVLRPTGLKLYEPNINVQHHLNYNPKSKVLACDLLEVKLAGLQTLAEKLNLTWQSDGQLDIQTQGTFQADLAQLEPWMVMFGKLDPKTQLAGQLNGRASYSRRGGQENLAITSEVLNLGVQLPGKPTFNEPKINLEAEASADRAAKVFELSRLKVASTFLQLNAQATSGLGEPSSPAKVSLQGQCELERLGQLVRPWISNWPDLVGTGRLDVELAGTSPKTAGPQWVNSLSGTGKLNFDQQLFRGLRLGPAAINMQVQNGLLIIPPSSIPANEGKMTVQARVALADKKPFLSVTESVWLLENVQINPEMSEGLLKFINPIFANSHQVVGTVNLRCDQLTVDEPKTWKQNAKMKAQFSGKDLLISSRAGLMKDLIGLLGIDLNAKLGEVYPVSIELANGVVSYKDMHILFGPLVDLSFSGQVGLDGKLNMKVGIPIMPAMLSNQPELIKYLGDQRIYLPITGTVDNPRLDIAALPKILESLISEAWKRLAVDQAGQLFQDLLKPQPKPAPSAAQ